MHENKLDIRAERQERERHRFLTGLATCNHLDLSRKVGLIKQIADQFQLIDRRRHDDHVDGMRGAQCPNSVHEQWRAPEQPKCLRGARPESFAAPRRRHAGRGSPFGCHRDLGGEDLVEDRLGFVLIGLLGQGQFTYEDLPSLRQHALLACGQAPLSFTAPQITNNLGNLNDVA